jgi:Raf kinase inhibitor-like YbhB/YbcL family protein
MAIQLTSSAFTQGNPIPAVYTCNGKNISPPLEWADSPSGTQGLALIVDDPDAPGGTWTHWVIYNLPASKISLDEGIHPLERLPDGSLNGKNSWGKLGYGGPCPPSGTHRYFFKLYALDHPLSLSPGASAAQLVKAMQGHILATAELMGTYRRQP